MTEHHGPPTPERALARYRELVEQSDQAPPFLLASFSDQAAAQAIPIHRMGENPRVVLDGLAAMAQRGELSPLRWVLFCAETYIATASEPGAFDTMEPGELSARAEIGMSGVDEAIMAHLAHADGTTWAAYQRFVRRPALGAMSWQEPEVLVGSEEVQGGIPDDLAMMVGRRVAEPPPASRGSRRVRGPRGGF